MEISHLTLHISMQLIQDKYNKLFQEFHIVKIYKKGALSQDKAPFTFNCLNQYSFFKKGSDSVDLYYNVLEFKILRNS